MFSMPYLIDGHNLIPKVPGLTLEAVDDEQQLIELLQEFCRIQRKEIEVFFDNAPPGSARARSFGLVTARFTRQGTTADAAIHLRLGRLGRQARNWTVVSSDQAVQSAARAAQAQYLSSEAFASLLKQAVDDSARDEGEKADIQLGKDELDEWIQLFGDGAGKD
jgi:predicted RNA-binding protein with PIN domain